MGDDMILTGKGWEFLIDELKTKTPHPNFGKRRESLIIIIYLLPSISYLSVYLLSIYMIYIEQE